MQGIIELRICGDSIFRSSHLEVFLGKRVLNICSKFTEHPCRSVILIKLLCSFIEITLWHGCCPVNLLHMFRTPFLKITSGYFYWHFTIVQKKTPVFKSEFVKWIWNCILDHPGFHLKVSHSDYCKHWSKYCINCGSFNPLVPGGNKKVTHT